MADGAPRPPPPPTDAHGSATRPCQSCGSDSVKLGPGYPILPVRYAVIPGFLERPNDILAGAPTLEQFANMPVSGHKYTLRVLREGYVHVWLGVPGKWSVYAVGVDGLLRKLMNPDRPAEAVDRTIAAIDRDAQAAVSCFIHIPRGYTKVWIALSETIWTPAVRRSMQKDPTRRMQAFDIEALGAAPDAHPHAFELTADAAKLVAMVEEYANRPTYIADNTITGERGRFFWDSAFGWRGRGGQEEALGVLAQGYAEKIKATKKVVRKVAVVALHDPVGMVKETNQTRLHFAGVKQRYCEHVMRKIIVAQSIDGLEKLIRDSTFQRLKKEEEAKGLGDVQEHWTPAGCGISRPYKDTRAERAKALADPAWERLSERLEAGAKQKFERQHRKTIRGLDQWIRHGDTAWATWARDPAWMGWFGDYDSDDEAKRAEFVVQHAACLEGGVLEGKSMEVWKEWLAKQPQDSTNPVYRTLFGPRSTLLAFVTPGENGELNKTDELYDFVKGLVETDEAKKFGVGIKSAATTVSLAIGGALAAVADDVAVAARDAVARAQQAAVLLYERKEATLLKVQMTLAEYCEMLGDVAFGTRTALTEGVQGVLKRGSRVVKSAVIGGVLSIQDPKLRNAVIEVVIWTYDTIEEIKAKLGAIGDAVGAATTRAIDVTRDAALRGLRVASINLNRKAAELLGAAKGQLIGRARQLGEFAKDMLTKATRVAQGAGERMLGAGAVFFQAWGLWEGYKEARANGALNTEAQLALVSAGVGLIGASMEAVAVFLSKEVAKKSVARLGGVFSAVSSLVDSVQAGFAAARSFGKGDDDAGYWYAAASFCFAAGAAASIYAIGATALLGPVGIALGLIVLGVLALWAAMNAEDTVAEIWMDRCCFGKGERGEGKWTDAQAVEELEHLNAIVVGLAAQVEFSDAYWGLGQLIDGYDTVNVKVTFADFKADQSEYAWSLWLHHEDGRRIQAAADHWPLAPVSASAGLAPSAEEALWLKNRDIVTKADGNNRVIEGGIDVLTTYFQRVTIEASYFIDRMDRAAVARVAIEDKD